MSFLAIALIDEVITEIEACDFATEQDLYFQELDAYLQNGE